MSSRELAATPKDLAMLAHSITAYLASLQKQPRTKRERALSVTLTDVRGNIQRALKNGERLSLSPDELHAVHVALAGLMGEMVLFFPASAARDEMIHHVEDLVRDLEGEP